jgi:hypothetical protein
MVHLAPDGTLESHEVTAEAGYFGTFSPEEWKLFPDGQGAYLLGHRNQPLVDRIDTVLALSRTRLSPGTLSPGSATYGMEYVLGDDGAYALEHGFANGQNWSKTYTFDPVTLDVLGSSFVTSGQPEPSQLRLRFAVAGGGVQLSGPGAPAAAVAAAASGAVAQAPAHATQISDGVWAGWGSGPTVMLQDPLDLAETVWPVVNATLEGANLSQRPGIGLFGKGHTVERALPFRHASIRIVPRDQAYWRQREPEIFREVDERSRYFATIGAGPPEGDTAFLCNGVLIGNFDRARDVHEKPVSLERLRYAPLLENAVIERLIEANKAYRDKLKYACFPDERGPEYNSNSYIAGILNATAMAHPRFPYLSLWRYPGWSKPVPTKEFDSSKGH